MRDDIKSILGMLILYNSLSIQDLAKYLFIQEKTIKFLVNDLFYLGLIDKDVLSNEEVNYKITNKGIQYYKELT